MFYVLVWPARDANHYLAYFYAFPKLQVDRAILITYLITQRHVFLFDFWIKIMTNVIPFSLNRLNANVKSHPYHIKPSSFTVDGTNLVRIYLDTFLVQQNVASHNL